MAARAPWTSRGSVAALAPWSPTPAAVAGGGAWEGFSDAYVLPIALHGPPVAAVAHSGAQLRAVRAVAPKAGTLNGLYAANTGLGAACNHVGAIYGVDHGTFDRAKLWQGAWSAPATANAWYSLGNPGLAVAAGDWLELALAVDAAAGPTFLRTATWPLGPRMPNAGDFPCWLYSTGIVNGAQLPAALALAALLTATPAPFLVATYA